MADTGILGIVVCKLDYWQELYSIILLEINKSSEIGFYHTILTLGLSVYLRIKHSLELFLDAEEVIKQ